MKISKVIIVINRGKEHARQTARVLKEILDHRKIRQQWLSAIPFGKNLYRSLHSLPAKSADLIIACGGDGTLLQTAHRFTGSGIPILGVNIGYMGFITSIEGEGVTEELGRILDGDFIVSERTSLDLLIDRPKTRPLSGWALNDVVISRGANPRLINVRAWVGRRPLTHFRCDGVIVATPTGSTAYSLAAGGPIISPECNALTITPICPQALTNRSVVVASTETIEMSLAGSGQGTVQLDGMDFARLNSEGTLSILTSEDTVPIAFLPEINFYDILGQKLKWTGDWKA